MKRTIFYKIFTGIIMLAALSCTERNWNDYYTEAEYMKAGNSLEILAKNPAYTEFVSLLRKTKSDSALIGNQVYTVLALKNGSFSGIDTVSNLAKLKKILGMHILPSIISKENMGNSNRVSVSGKLLRFSSQGESVTVNGVPVSAFDLMTSNGIIHEVGQVIVPRSNLYDVVMDDPEFSDFRDFITNSYHYVIDPVNNIKLGYDTLNQPIYKEPVNYMSYSEYLQTSGLQNEKLLTTGFFPSAELVGKVVGDMLHARGDRQDLIVPRLSNLRNDTIIGYRYFKEGYSYEGDTTALLNDLFRYVIVRSAVPEIGGNSMTSISGYPLRITETRTDAVMVSNGYYYVLDELDIPESFYRKEFFFLPSPKIQDPANPEKQIANPDIIYGNGANASPAVVGKATVCLTDKFTRFNFVRVGATIDFKFPFVTKGAYDVVLSYFPEDNHGLADVSYGEQVLIRDLETSKSYNSRALTAVAKTLGTIYVNSNGSVQIRFTCSNSNLKNFGKYTFGVDYLKLQPVTVP